MLHKNKNKPQRIFYIFELKLRLDLILKLSFTLAVRKISKNYLNKYLVPLCKYEAKKSISITKLSNKVRS